MEYFTLMIFGFWIGNGLAKSIDIDWQCIGIELAVDRPLGKI